TEDVFMACRYCYEQEVPAGTPDSVRGAWMFNELNAVLYGRLKSKATIVSRLQPGYVLEKYPAAPRRKQVTANAIPDEAAASDSRTIQEMVETAVRELFRVNGRDCPFVFDLTETTERI